MLTLQKLKELKQSHRNNEIIYKLLATIIGECEQISKDPSEDQILQIMMKIYKENNQTLNECKDRFDVKEELMEENNFIKSFLPQQLTYTELAALINSQIVQGKKLPAIMSYLSQNYKGQYDSKKAIEIIKYLE